MAGPQARILCLRIWHALYLGRDRRNSGEFRRQDAPMKLDPARHDWMRSPETSAVFDALGGEARFVGGAIRNALMDKDVADIDIATPLVPEDVMTRLRAAGLGAVP